MTARKRVSHEDFNGLKATNLGAPDAASNDAARISDVEAASAADRSRANHNGTQLASTISDFDARVRTSRLDQMAAPTAPLSANGQRITSLADPGVAQDAATKNYVDQQVAGLVSGQAVKGSVRVAATGNVTIASPGASIDGVTLVNGDLILLVGQTDPAQNGPYVFNGAVSALTRASNWDSDVEAVLGSYWVVREGSKADSFALLTNDSAITLGTTALIFTFISVAGAAIGRFSASCPAVSAGGTWAVTHNLNSRDVHVMVRRTASPYDLVDVYTEATTLNTVTVSPDLAMAAGEFTAVVKY